MPSKISEIVSDARKLSGRLKPESSIDLAPVRDQQLGIRVLPWRHTSNLRDHALHGMISRVGGFPARLARYFVAAYTNAGEVVLDPFCGKGTALFESVCMGRPAIGGDIAPDAVIVSRAKCLPVTVSSVARYIESLPIGRSQHDSDTPRDVALFFSKGTLRELLSVRAQLLEDVHSSGKRDIATFVCGVMLGILHGHSRVSLSLPCNQAFAMSPNYVRKYVAEHGLQRPARDIRRCLLEKSLALLPAPKMLAKASVFEAPAQECGRYMKRCSSTAKLILTSPPYLNRQTYIRDSWLRLWFLNRAGSELREKTLETGNVLTFVNRLRAVLPAMNEVLSPGGRIVLVCGQAKITLAGRDHSVRVADLCLYALNSLSERRCFVVEELIMDKKLMTRGSYFAVHRGQSNGSNGQQTRRYGEDEILVLRKKRA